MKKLLLLTVALLALGSTLAFAQDTIDLGWVGCRTSANNGSATLNDVTPAQFICYDQVAPNLAARSMVAAYKTGTYTNFQGATIQLDFITGGAPIVPDWWDVGNKILDANNCRAGGMVRGTVGVHSS